MFTRGEISTDARNNLVIEEVESIWLKVNAFWSNV